MCGFLLHMMLHGAVGRTETFGCNDASPKLYQNVLQIIGFTDPSYMFTNQLFLNQKLNMHYEISKISNQRAVFCQA